MPADGAGKWRISGLIAKKGMFSRRTRLMFESSSMMKSKDLCIVVIVTVQNLIRSIERAMK